MLIMELKMAQEIIILGQDPLLLVFLDLQKSYKTLDRGIFIQTLEGYEAGTKMQRLLT